MNAYTKSSFGLGLLGMLAVACGGADPSANGSLSSGITGNDAGAGEFVFVQGTSASYSIAPLNGSGRGSTVTSIDFSAAGVDPTTLATALATPFAVAATGSVQGDVFVANAVYQTLPGIAPAMGDSFYVTGAANLATELNVGTVRMFGTLDLTQVGAPFVDKTWLAARIHDGTAVVAGSFDGDLQAAPFDVSAVYLQVPDTTKCPQLVISCAEGTVTTYSRDANRCLESSGCTTIGTCPEFVPVCDPGYTLSRWTGGNGCSSFACDPAFDPAPGQ